MRAELREIHVAVRTDTSKPNRQRLRGEGKVPAIIYGRGIDPLAVAVDEKSFLRELPEPAWYSTPLRLVVEGDALSPTVMVAAVQRNLVTRHLVAIDFHVVSMEDLVHAQVPVHAVGQPRGLRRGGILEQPAHVVTIEARPGDIPDHLEVDISSLDIGDHLRVADIPTPEGVRITDPANEMVFLIGAPAHAEAEEGVVPATGAVVEEVEQPAAQGEE